MQPGDRRPQAAATPFAEVVSMQRDLVLLPPTGRSGPAPKCPYALAGAGSAWWAWAWATPQATRWDAGVLYTVARRAHLEDDLAALATRDAPAKERRRRRPLRKGQRGYGPVCRCGAPKTVAAHTCRKCINRPMRREPAKEQSSSGERERAKDAAARKLAVAKEMRELDGKLGLTPRAMLDLGWVVGEAAKESDDLDMLAAKRAKRIAGGAAT